MSAAHTKKRTAMNKKISRASAIAFSTAAVYAAFAGSANAQSDWQPLGGGESFNTASLSPQDKLPSAADGLPGNGWNLVSKEETAPTPAAPAQAPQKVAAASGAIAAAPVATPAEVVVTPVPPVASFDLVAGQSLEAQIQAWAKRVGWSVVWKATDDYIVPAPSSYGSDFIVATQTVFDDAAKNGADFRADIYKGNRSVVIDQSGASE
ncbi:toxin co-regulated pilus biosynthesis Q family protein [Burkholderia sp. Ac-20365]|uniref:toxin co-regulated pilus biosynthesis Q family protein n=1 Tax=Burkholderia sp. Ac-20365 TaxID=2703897 RepID=UPI00197B5962|nr:toxin co-regulated pilus biosynthesis Q family protein [Burkholderia sp. Ac-20365]MBN3761065.1 hypothetical protein [Burkholderia sp. Ac-20365]